MNTEKSPLNLAFSTVLVGIFAALVAVMGLVRIEVPGMAPITGQTFAVMLAGALLGPARAGLSMLLFYVLLAAGLPIAAGGRGGIGVLAGPSGGYFIGFIVGAVVIGFLVKYIAAFFKQGWQLYVAILVSCIVGGILVVYLFGVPWTAVNTGSEFFASLARATVYIPGDLIKAVVASAVAFAVLRTYSGLLGLKK